MMFLSRCTIARIVCKGSSAAFSTGGGKDSLRTSEHSVTPVNLAYASYESTMPVDPLNANPVIITHGLLGSKLNWNSLAKGLHQRTRKKVITVDARNHGDSPHSTEHTYLHMAEDLFCLMKSMKIKQATLMGHSMGGRAIMAAALQKPSLVERLVVVDVSPVNSPSLNSMQDFLDAMRSIDLPERIPLSQARKVASDQLLITIPDATVRQFVLTNLVEDNGYVKWRCNLEALSSNFLPFIAQFPRDLLSGSRKFKGRALFVAGGNSDYLRSTDHDIIRTLFPHAEFVYVEDAGHWVHADKPQEFLDIVAEFIQQRD